MKLQNYLIGIFILIALIVGASQFASRGLAVAGTSSADLNELEGNTSSSTINDINGQISAISGKIDGIKDSMSTATLWNIIFQAIPGLLDVLFSIIVLGINIPLNTAGFIMASLHLPEWFKVLVTASASIVILLKVYFIVRGTGEA